MEASILKHQTVSGNCTFNYKANRVFLLLFYFTVFSLFLLFFLADSSYFFNINAANRGSYFIKKTGSLKNDFSIPFLKGFKARVKRQADMFPGMVFLESPYETKEIALTFDDGPHRYYTPKILKILRKHNVKATFFMIGYKIIKNRDLVKLVVEDGHSVGGHTYSHRNISRVKNSPAYYREILPVQNMFKNIIGYRPSIFRPPYGYINNDEIEFFNGKGLYTILWSIDSMDWYMRRSRHMVTENIRNYIHPGAIVLMHDACLYGCYTHEALDILIPELKEKGYKFVTIPELLGINEKAD